MHIEPRLLVFTKGVRGRIAGAVAIGLVSVGLGVARLGLLGWLIGQVFAGRTLSELVPSVLLIALVMVLRGAAEHWRAVVAHETAARVQKALRRTLYDRIAALGPGTVGRQRSGALTLSMIDGVEQLETYFGQFLPQFLIALLSPVLIFASWPSSTCRSRWSCWASPWWRCSRPACGTSSTSRTRCTGRDPMPPSPPSSSIRSRGWRP